jgi:cytoskeletal protein CcmA (bactofilin family)
MNHFDEMAALLYLEGQLDPERAREIAAHAAECLSCRELLGALESEGVWLRQSLAAEEESVPARLMEAPERGSTPWGWIMALALSASGAYTLWTSVVVPWKSQAAQAGFTQSNLLSMLFFSGAFWKGWDAMRSITEFLAISTLTVVITWLLRRHWRRLTTVAVVLGAVAFALAAASPAGAAETRRGDPSYTLSAGQEIHTDLFVLADRVVIDGDVDGDLAVWSREVTVNGHVKGDVLCGGQTVRINGTVDGNVRVFAHDVDVTGTVGRNVMTWSNEISLDDKGSIGGTATFGANNATLNGKVAGDVLGIANFVDISGMLGQNVNLRADHLTISSTANIKGLLKYGSRREADIAEGAKIGSIQKVTPTSRPTYASGRYYWHRVLFWGVGFVFGLVLMLLVPGFYADATGECRKYAPAAGFGLLFLFATPIAAFIACITIVGLGVGIATFLLYAIAIYAATIFVSGFVGEALLGPKPGTGAAIARLALGLLILHVLRALPYIGGWVLFIEIFWGLGALVLALYKRLRTQAAVPVPA